MDNKVQKLEEVIKHGATAEELAEIERLINQAKGKGVGYGDQVFGDIQKIIDKNRNKAGALIRVLQEAQIKIGYLPTPVIATISRDLKVPLSEVYGVVSFYHFFSLKPKGKYVVQVCLGTSCYVKGADKIMDVLKRDWNLDPGGITPDGRFSLEIVRCLGACGLAPVVAINSDIHGKVKPGNMKDILDSYN
jgi:NADH:ubiquinone oxidoreductase subunit E